MLQLENGTPQPITAEPAKPRYTGEVLMRTRPKTYRKVIELLSHDRSVLSIAEECKVSRMTVDAIAERHATPISQRKTELVSMLSDLASVATGRAHDTVKKASFRDAIVGAGISVDKILALTGTTAPSVGVVVMPSDTDREERRQLHDKLDAIARRLADS
jgi:hypothetical protein